MNIYEKLLAIQTELKAPKSQYNSFGKYHYRNCEDILEAVKPICGKHGAVVTIGDEIVLKGDRFYVEATATLIDVATGATVSNTAYAREEAEKKGMDGSQVTGASSSYARKYALNGLFAIDDTKDSDTTNIGDGEKKKEDTKKKAQTPREKLIAKLHELGKDVGEYAKEKGVTVKTTPERFEELLAELEGAKND